MGHQQHLPPGTRKAGQSAQAGLTQGSVPDFWDRPWETLFETSCWLRAPRLPLPGRWNPKRRVCAFISGVVPPLFDLCLSTREDVWVSRTSPSGCSLFVLFATTTSWLGEELREIQKSSVICQGPKQTITENRFTFLARLSASGFVGSFARLSGASYNLCPETPEFHMDSSVMERFRFIVRKG